MNPNRLKNSVLAACAALTFTGATVYASNAADGAGAKTEKQHQMHHRHGARHGSPLMSTLKQLDLSAQQQQSIKAVFQGNADKRKALRDQQRANRQALATTMPDDANYPALIAAQKQLAADAIQQMSDTQTQIYAVLTPEQRAKVPEILAERKAKWEQRREQFRNRMTESTAS